MARLKCIACGQLKREVVPVSGKDLVVYSCTRFPYQAALSGLLRPSKGLARAAEGCPLTVWGRCLLCKENASVGLGGDFRISLCLEHNRAWGDWLRAHPEKRGYFAPRHRAIGARWLEVFREFVQEVQRERN